MYAKQLAVFVLSATLLMAPVLASTAREKPSAVAVSIFTFNCPKFSGLLQYTIDGHSASIRAQRLQQELYRIDLSVLPGHHELLLYSSSESAVAGCTTQRTFTALPGHSRYIAMALGVVLARRSNCSIAGTLPIEGMSAKLVLPKGSLVPNTLSGGYLTNVPSSDDLYYPLEIDDAAYYSEHISPVRYVLRLSLGGWTGDVPLDLRGKANIDKPGCRGDFIHNISIDEVKHAFPVSDVSE